MTLKLYRDDPYLLEFDAALVEQVEHGGRPAAVLDRTAFYAESGGQPWDLGTLEGVAVTAVIEDGARVVHMLERPLPARPAGATRVRGVVDGVRRRDHMQQHHGQHLLSRALEELCGARTVGFHLGSDDTTIDLDRPVEADALRRAVRRANEIVWQARPVVVRTVSPGEAERLGCRVPAEAGQGVRLVEAEGFDRQPCSGTHPRNTAEVGVVIALQAERHKGATRLHLACGQRALAALEARLQVLERLGATLSAPFDKLPESARRALDELARTRQRAEDLLERALQGEARELLSRAGSDAAGAPAVVVAAFDSRPAAELRALALALTAAAPCVALLGSHGEAAQLVFARSKGLPVDLSGLLRDALAVVGGRGGGQGDVVQGGGPQAERLEEALAVARARLPNAGA